MGTRSALALVAAAAFAFAGCSGDEEDADPVEGTGYTYSVPDGWEDVSDSAEEEIEVGGFRPDTLVVGDREDDFATNVNVVREAGLPSDVTAEQYADVSIAGLRDPAASGLPPEVAATVEELNPSGISEPREVDLGGEEAVEWDYRSTQDGRDVRVRQLVAVMDGAGYTLTLTVLPAGFGEGNEALGEVTASWEWE
jgi:hypothetical protein